MAPILLWLGGCAGPLIAPLPTPFPTAQAPAEAYLPAEEALPALVAAERTASIAGDLAGLAQLWLENSRVVDGRNTPDADDDYVWSGRAAVLDRYVTAVFPNPPPPATFEQLELAVTGREATGVNGGDRWRFVYADGRWWLAELVYQAPE